VEQAREDLATARYNLDGARYYAAAFFCHQAVEEALKALYMAERREQAGPTHSLIYLARQCEVPQEFHRFLKELTPEYVVSRYPNATDEVPAALYEREFVEDYLQKSAEVLRWIAEKLGLSRS
jgi:HEPN domain-containing protein